MEHLGKVSEDPGSLKMSLERLGGREEDIRGNRVCKAVEVGMSWAQVEVVRIVVSQEQKVNSEEDSLVCLGRGLSA